MSESGDIFDQVLGQARETSAARRGELKAAGWAHNDAIERRRAESLKLLPTLHRAIDTLLELPNKPPSGDPNVIGSNIVASHTRLHSISYSPPSVIKRKWWQSDIRDENGWHISYGKMPSFGLSLNKRQVRHGLEHLWSLDELANLGNFEWGRKELKGSAPTPGGHLDVPDFFTVGITLIAKAIAVTEMGSSLAPPELGSNLD